MGAPDHIEELHEQGWTRVDTAPGEWVALLLNDDATAFGGTLWKKAEDGNYYAEGATAGFPISAALDFVEAGRAVAVHVKKEISA